MSQVECFEDRVVNKEQAKTKGLGSKWSSSKRRFEQSLSSGDCVHRVDQSRFAKKTRSNSNQSIAASYWSAPGPGPNGRADDTSAS